MTTAAKHNQEEVATLVQAALDRHPQHGFKLTVEPAGLSRRDDWWYVTVLPDHEGVSAYDYSNCLRIIEDELEERESLKVLLVPTLVD